MPVSTSVQSKASVALPANAQKSEKVASGRVGAVNKLDSGVDKVADKVCWIEVKRYPYHPDHQVELLHLQAEADALIIKLQAAGQKNQVQQAEIN
ncbi:MAG: hypothetical protein AAFP03_03865 [Cyanobacteria bacterium J06598_3]